VSTAEDRLTRYIDLYYPARPYHRPGSARLFARLGTLAKDAAELHRLLEQMQTTTDVDVMNKETDLLTGRKGPVFTVPDLEELTSQLTDKYDDLGIAPPRETKKGPMCTYLSQLRTAAVQKYGVDALAFTDSPSIKQYDISAWPKVITRQDGKEDVESHPLDHPFLEALAPADVASATYVVGDFLHRTHVTRALVLPKD
jgi:hypothetical protein